MAKPKTMRHASALKAHRKSLVREAQNFKVRSKVRTLTSSVLKAIQDKNLDVAKTRFSEAQSAWQKAAKRGIFHANVAARKIAHMSSRLHAATKS
jgi:small subunit ribosomal protein S20